MSCTCYLRCLRATCSRECCFSVCLFEAPGHSGEVQPPHRRTSISLSPSSHPNASHVNWQLRVESDQAPLSLRLGRNRRLVRGIWTADVELVHACCKGFPSVPSRKEKVKGSREKQQCWKWSDRCVAKIGYSGKWRWVSTHVDNQVTYLDTYAYK